MYIPRLGDIVIPDRGGLNAWAQDYQNSVGKVTACSKSSVTVQIFKETIGGEEAPYSDLTITRRHDEFELLCALRVPSIQRLPQRGIHPACSYCPYQLTCLAGGA